MILQRIASENVIVWYILFDTQKTALKISKIAIKVSKSLVLNGHVNKDMLYMSLKCRLWKETAPKHIWFLKILMMRFDLVVIISVQHWSKYQCL